MYPKWCLLCYCAFALFQCQKQLLLKKKNLMYEQRVQKRQVCLLCLLYYYYFLSQLRHPGIAHTSAIVGAEPTKPF